MIVGALVATACSQPAAPPKASLLNHVASVNAADAVPELMAALRSDLKLDAVAGVDVATAYAAIDKELAPLLAEFQGLLVQAPEKITPAPQAAVTAAGVASARAGSTVLMGTEIPGRTYIINKTYDAGEQFTGAGLTEDVKGSSEEYLENGQVVIHMDMTGEASKATGQGEQAQTSLLVQHLLIGEAKAGDGFKTYVDLCPDAGGLSRGKLHFEIGAGGQVTGNGGQRGGQATFVVSADLLGHVDDSARLTSYDLTNLSLQRSATGSGSPDPAGFFAEGFSLTGVPSAGDPWTTSGTAVAGANQRSRIHNMTQADVQREIGLMVLFAKFHVLEMYRLAEKAWRDGYCVKVVATKGPDPKRLRPGQTTHFTIDVMHKLDGTHVDGPVVAVATNGKADPENRPVKPPAQFSFTAAGGKPRSYSVELTSTSRRGIGTLGLNFSPGYDLKITFVAGPSARGLPNTVPDVVTGTILMDASGTSMSGGGTLQGEGYRGKCGAWGDAGPVSVPVQLKATDTGDGNFALTITSNTDHQLPPLTFPAAGGTVTSTGTFNDCGARSGTATVEAQPVPN